MSDQDHLEHSKIERDFGERIWESLYDDRLPLYERFYPYGQSEYTEKENSEARY